MNFPISRDPLEAPRPVSRVDTLIVKLDQAIQASDDAYVTVLEAWPEGLKQTEERIKVAVRNELRSKGVTLPEIVRWQLRGAIGYRSEED